MGTVTVFVIYTAFTLNCFFSPYCIHRVSLKKSLCISVYGYILFLASGVIATSCKRYPTLHWCQTSFIYSANMLGAIACGSSAAVIWVAASSYISCSARDETHKNHLFGVFGACALGSHLFGNLSTVLLLHYFDHLVYFGLLFGLAFLSA